MAVSGGPGSVVAAPPVETPGAESLSTSPLGVSEGIPGSGIVAATTVAELDGSGTEDAAGGIGAVPVTGGATVDGSPRAGVTDEPVVPAPVGAAGVVAEVSGVLVLDEQARANAAMQK